MQADMNMKFGEEGRGHLGRGNPETKALRQRQSSSKKRKVISSQAHRGWGDEELFILRAMGNHGRILSKGVTLICVTNIY